MMDEGRVVEINWTPQVFGLPNGCAHQPDVSPAI
jgi:hypothetical protein